MSQNAKRAKVPKPGTVLNEDMKNVVASFEHESDRGLALIGGAILEELLGELIVAKTVATLSQDFRTSRMFGSDSFAGTLSRRIAVGRAFGLAPEGVFDALEVVRKIRNSAAHFTRPLGSLFSFGITEVADALRKSPLMPAKWVALRSGDANRNAFIGLVAELLQKLSLELSVAKSEPPRTFPRDSPEGRFIDRGLPGEE